MAKLASTRVYGNLIVDNALNIAGQLTSTAATGTAPFAVSSTTKVTNLNADTLDDLHASTSATVSTIAARDSNGYIYSVFFNSSRSNENTAAASYLYDSGDGWMRKKTLANVKTELVTSAAVIAGLGFTPYNATNPSSYISGITSSMVTTALGFTPYNSTNPAGYTTNVGTITGVTAGVGISGGGTSGTVSVALDFSELTDMTADISGTTEFILQNGTTESRKAANEIKLSNFVNDSGWTSNAGTVTSVGGTANQITSSGGAAPTIGLASTITGITSLTSGTLVATTGITTGSSGQTWVVDGSGTSLLFQSGATPTTRLTLTNAGALTVTGAIVASNFSGSSSGTNTGDQTTITGSAGSVANSITFNNGGSGNASGTTFNGSATRTISYNTVGAAASSHDHTFASLTSKPSTISGYGITDGAVNFGSRTNTATTTEAFITLLTSWGMFNYGHSFCKFSWNYAGNEDITDITTGSVETAGAVCETWQNGDGTKMVRLICPNTGTGNAYREFIYNDQGSGYSPGWREVWNSRTLTNLNQLTNGPGYVTANNYLTGVTGSGNGTVTFARQGLGSVTWNASHTHTEYAPTTGSSSITTLGTIGTGTWQGSVINSTYGGTGVNNGGRTLAVNTNSGTLAFANASKTLTVTNDASISGTNTGDQTTITGNAGSASAVLTSAENTGTTPRYLLFANAVSGNQALKTDSGLTYHPTNNTITANLEGTASGNLTSSSPLSASNLSGRIALGNLPTGTIRQVSFSSGTLVVEVA